MKQRIVLLAFAIFASLTISFGQFPTSCVSNAVISVKGGENGLINCNGDGIPDVYTFKTNILPTPFAFLVTDENNIILGISVNNTIDLEQFGPGSLRVWAFSFIGQITAQIGQDATTAQLASICYALTVNYIDVQNVIPDGGTVSTGDGNSSQYVCPDDPDNGVVDFATTSGNPVYTYVITDENNKILDFAPDGSYDFSTSPNGICRVWGLAYVGEILVVPGDDLTTSEITEECYALSDNFIEIIKADPDAGMVSLADGSTETTVCVGDGVADVLSFINNTTSLAPYAYIITDDNNIILDVVIGGNTFDFDGAPAGTCLVWGLSYSGTITAPVGADVTAIELADGCFDLSSNFISVMRKDVEGGEVALEGGGTAATVCVNDGVADVLTYTNNSTSGESYLYLVTDENNIILAILTGNSNDFDGGTAGVCRVWGLSYSGSVLAEVGDDAAAVALTDECYELSSNFITVTRKEVDGGTVALAGGGTSAVACVNDGVADVFNFTNTSASSESYTYVVTDENNNILKILDTDSNDFEGAGLGICRVWGLSYSGAISAEVGDDATVVALSDECFELSSNFISINRKDVDGGEVALEGGGTEATVCVNDGVPDILTYTNNSTSGESYLYLVTDENNSILAILTGDSNDFDGAGTGICRVWGVSYSGNVLVDVGDDAATAAISDECYELSSNFITVTRKEVDGGEVALADGGTETVVCVGDGIADVLSYVNTSTSSESYTYVVTDENNDILAILDTDSNDFEGADIGICRVWGLSYSGTITAAVGDNAANVALSDECYELSANFITVNRKDVDGAEVALTGGGTEATVCVGDGVADELSFTNTSSSAETYIYIVTDENNEILAVLSGNSNDFEGAGIGICRVWGLSYSGNLLAQVGDDAAAVMLSDECYELSSNFITVNRLEVDGNEISLSNGSLERTVCVNDGEPDVLEFVTATTSAAPYVFVVTDENNVILEILSGNTKDFDGAGTGICLVWGVSYTGNIQAQVGDDLSAIDFSDECFELSELFVRVIRKEVDGGEVALLGGGTEATVCVGDGVIDELVYTNTSTSTETYAYLVTDENNTILAIIANDSNNFDDADPGICRVWGVSYSGTLLAENGDDAATVAISDECYELSSNFITVTRKEVDGGFVTLEDGSTETLVCLDGIDNDSLGFVTTSNALEDYVYIITDENNKILAVSDVAGFDFRAMDPGICRVWGLSFSGNLTAPIGGAADIIDLSDECYDLSDNFIVVEKKAVDGGTVGFDNGTTDPMVACVGDGVPDVFGFIGSAGVVSTYGFIVTDEDNNILSILLNGANTQDFEGADVGVCRVWGVSYTGSFIAEVGDNAATVPLSDECYDLSNNFLEVRRESVDGGTVSTPDGDDLLYVCPGDNNPDVIHFDSTGMTSAGYVYVITDTSNVVLSVTNEDFFDFNDAPAGICRVWGLAYSGDLANVIGEDADLVALSDECFDLSDNYLTVVREKPDAGTVAMPNGETVRYTCPGDDNPDIVQFDSLDTSDSPYLYIITDENNNILALPDGDFADFNDAPIGLCRVWGLAYTGNFIGQVGDNILGVFLSDDCYDLSDNFITVVRDVPEGGTISASGDDTVYICPGDGMEDIVTFNTSGASTSLYAFILTDENNSVLAVLTSNSVDFDPVPAGTCRVWGLSYTGNLTVNIGDDAATADLSDDCFDLSDNFVTVIKEEPAAGLITANGGQTEFELCVGDGIPDVINFEVDGASYSQFSYLVTDENGFLIGVLEQDSFDFEFAIGGTFLIYGLAYTGNFSGFPGDNIFDFPLSTDCFSISSNFLTLNLTQVDGAFVTTSNAEDIVYVCPGDGVADFVTFVNTSAATDATYQYVLTTESNLIIAVLPGATQNFENTGFDVLRLWGISYTGNFLGSIGNNLETTTLSDECYAISGNFVTIIRDEPEGGVVTTEDGTTDVKFCIVNGDTDLTMTTTSTSNAGYVYLLTDTSNVVISVSETPEVDFGTLDQDLYRVWGLSYTGMLLVEAGMDLDDAAAILATSCYELSDNFVTVDLNESVDGGTLTTLDGEDVIYTCPGDDVADLVILFTSSLDTSYRFFITDTMNRILQPDVQGNVINFDAAAPGVCRIYGISYTGDLDLSFGEHIYTDELSTDCWAVSVNYITLVRQVPEGGMVMTTDGSLEVEVTPGDGEPDVVEFAASGNGIAPYAYVITDENNIILDITLDASYDFENDTLEVCRVWGLSYTGMLTGAIGDDAAAVELSDDCFDLSDNFILIFKDIDNLQSGGEAEQAIAEGENVQSELLSLSIAPNPATDWLVVSFDTGSTASSTSTVQVIDFSGMVVYTQVVNNTATENRLELPINELTSGMYVVRIINGNSLKSQTFVKQQH